MNQIDKEKSDYSKKEQDPSWDKDTQEETEFKSREQQSQKAIEEKVQFALEESKAAIALADSAKQKAELARDRAEDARQEAEIVRSKAENARGEAEFSCRNAELTRRESESQRNILDVRRKEAVIAREIAEDALKEAETARKNAKLAEERYKLVLWGSNDGIWDLDIQKNTIYWNGRFFKMLGFSETNISPSNEALFERIHPEDKQRLKEVIDHSLTKHQHFEEVFRIKYLDENYLYCLVRGKTLLDETGHPIRMAGTITDITERKQMEIELEQAKQEAQLANQRKSEALASMAHELRTPLNAIIGYSEMLKQGIEVDPEKQERYATNIFVSGRHLLGMINDILDIARIEAGKIQLSPEWIELKPFINEIKGMVSELAVQKHLQLTFEVQPDIGRMEVDPSRFRQIFLNLLSNAIKFTYERGSITVRLFKSEDQQWIIGQVEDTGIGITQEKLSELFTRFYQVDTTTAGQQKGTGLGLALTKHLIEYQGGTITVESQEGSGTTFTFRLPVTTANLSD